MLHDAHQSKLELSNIDSSNSIRKTHNSIPAYRTSTVSHSSSNRRPNRSCSLTGPVECRQYRTGKRWRNTLLPWSMPCSSTMIMIRSVEKSLPSLERTEIVPNASTREIWRSHSWSLNSYKFACCLSFTRKIKIGKKILNNIRIHSFSGQLYQSVGIPTDRRQLSLHRSVRNHRCGSVSATI